MLLFHSTPGMNSVYLSCVGIALDFAKGKPQRVWLHSWRKRHWARLHLAGHHNCDPRTITTFAVNVPRGWLTHYRRGIWRCKRSIPCNRLIGQTFFLGTKELTDQTIFGYDFDIFSAPGQVPPLH